MNIYLAGVSSGIRAYLNDIDIYKGANMLESYYYANNFTEEVIIPNAKRFLLDSGAFTFIQNQKNEINWEEYIVKYANFINKNKVELFFELDIDDIVGYEKVKEYRKLLENLTQKKSIPVWHNSRGKDEWKKMCEEYDYVAIGGLVGNGGTRSEYAKKNQKYFQWFLDIAKERNAKVHALGFTSLEGLKKYKFYSVDSTTWLAGNRFGSIFYFDGRTMKRINKPPRKKLDAKKAAIHNFNEWKKFSKYAERNL